MSEVKNISSNKITLPQADGVARAKDLRASNLSASALRATGRDNRDPKMLEAAQGFENQFIRQMIGEMRKTVPHDEVVPEGMADGIFKEQLDNNYAEQWVNQGGIGLADIIYDQLQERYGNHVRELPKTPGAMLPLPVSGAGASGAGGAPGAVAGGGLNKPAAVAVSKYLGDQPRDLFSRADKNLFLAKKESGQFDLKSREPLAESVGIRSPLAGVVTRTATLDDGRELIIIKHDQGLVSQIVHTGDNHVKNNVRVAAGEVIAELPASKSGELARVLFGLRPGTKVE